MLPVCYPSSPSPTTGLPEAVAYALSSVSGLTRWVDYIPIKLVSGALGVNEQSTNVGGFTPMRLLSSAIGMAAWSDYIPVYVDNSATEAWVTSATGYIPYANSVSGATTPSFYLNLSNPSNATILDGDGRGTITSVRDAVISSSISVSRTSGVAPLYVNFDYTATTSSGSTNAPHECFFATDFGDPSSGTWANGVQSSGLTSKNAGYGPVTGHVYETPGTYNVTMVVTDGVNTSSRTAQITVQDPDTVYAGTDTIYLSHSGNFTGAPSGSSQPVITGNTDIFDLLNTYAASNKRILFCKADSWTCSDNITITGISGLTIDGYGTGVAAKFGSETLFAVTPAALGSSMLSVSTGCADIRICNMRINGNPTTHGVQAYDDISGLLWSRVEVYDCDQGFNAFNGVGVGNVYIYDEMCLYECVVDDLYGMPFIDTYGVNAAFDASTDTFTATAHGFAINQQVLLRGTVPTPLVVGTRYNISATDFTANTFKLSATSGGAVIDLTSTGSCPVGIVELHGGIGIFVAPVRGGVMGCYIDTCNKGEQTVRLPYLDRSHINNNYFARPNQTKNAIKVHGFIYSETPMYTEKFVISANEIDLRGGYSYGDALGSLSSVNPTFLATEVGNCGMVIGSGGNGGVGGERVRNGIVENNITHACLGSPKNTQTFAQINCPTMTVRNNIADFALGDRSTTYAGNYAYTAMHFVDTTTSTPDQTVDVVIYNNTLYSNMSNAEFAQFVRLSDAVTNPDVDRLTIKNNLWYVPFHGAFQKGIIYQQNGVGTNITTSNNTTNGNTVNTNPMLTAMPPVALGDWKPAVGSYAIDTGATVPVLRDFNNASRYGGTYDMGAVLP